MATFLNCLYHAHSFTAREKSRYDLDHVCCTPDALYGTDGKKLYVGHPNDYPWRELCRAVVPVDPDKPMIFLASTGRLKKSLMKDGYDLREGQLHALGTTWEVRADISFPRFERILSPLDSTPFHPVTVDQWKKMLQSMPQLAAPGNGRDRDCLVYISQERKRIVVRGKHKPLQFALSEKASEEHKQITFDLTLWPRLCAPPLEIALSDYSLLLRRGREKMILLGVKLRE